MTKWQTNYVIKLIQYTAIFLSCTIENFQFNNIEILSIFAKNIDCGYTLEPPQLETPYLGGSIGYPKSMFENKNNKKMYNPVKPCKPKFHYIKVGWRGYK